MGHIKEQTIIGERAVRQRTLKNSIHCTGVGLHTGARVTMTLHPGEPDTGIVFRRSDVSNGRSTVRAIWHNALETPLCTTLMGEGGVRIATIEHLMAAFAGTCIDNAVVEIDGPEVPIMDGSAAPFVFLIECAGIVEQDLPRRAIRILKRVAASESSRSASLSSGPGFSISFDIDFDNHAVSRQEWFGRITGSTFKTDICRARTFGFLHEVDRLREMGLAQGGSLDNAIVISGKHILNEGGLRYQNEFVRHKVLDSIGDLYLAGAPIIGHFHGFRTGHALNLRLLNELFASEDAWVWSEQTEADQSAPVGISVPPGLAVAARA